MYRYSRLGRGGWVCLAAALAFVSLRAPAQITITSAVGNPRTTSSVGAYYVPIKKDLANSDQPTFASLVVTYPTDWNFGVSSRLNDGLPAGNGYGTGKWNSAHYGTGPFPAVQTFTFNTTLNPNGYDISTIVSSSAEWADGRVWQKYTLEVHTVGGGWVTLSGDPGYTVDRPATGYSGGAGGGQAQHMLVTLERLNLTGVDQLRFTTPGASSVGCTAWSEIDILGAASGNSSIVWQSATDDAWGAGGNWVGGTAPGDSDTAVFNGSGEALAVTPDAGRSVRNILFDTAACRAYVIGTTDGSALTLSSGGILRSAPAILQPATVSAPLILDGANAIYTFTSDAVSGSATITIGGGITGGAAGSSLLILDGANAGANRIDGAVGNGAATALGIAKYGTGTWTLGGTNAYSGATTIGAGVLCADHATALGGGGDITFAGGTLQFGPALNGATLGWGARIKNSTLSGAILLDSNGQDVTLSGSIPASNSGGLTKSGAGTVTLSGNSAYTGSTFVDAGTLALSGSPTGNSAFTVNAGATLKLDYSVNNTGKLHDSAVLTLGGVLNLAGGSHVEMVASTALAANTASRVLRSGGTSVLRLGAITRNAGASIDFGAADIASTSTANSNGILGPWATIGSDFAINSGVMEGGGNYYIRPYSGYVDVTRLSDGAKMITSAAGSNVRVVDGTMPPAASITPASAGTTDINALIQTATGGSVTYDPGSADILRFGAAGGVTLANGAEAITLGTAPGDGQMTAGGAANTAGTLALANQDPVSVLTVNSALVNNGSGAMTLSKTGPGLVLLAGANTYTGPTYVAGGTLQIGTAGRLAGGTYSQPILLNSGAVFDYGSSQSQTLSGVISGSGALSKSGVGMLTLTAANTYAGPTIVGGGTLQLSGSGSLSPASALTVNGTLVFNRADALLQGTHFAGAISGSGGIAQSGSGSTVLNGANSYAGTTSVVSGTLQFAKLVSLYNNNPANWTPANVLVSSGATLGLNVGGAGEFAAGDVAVIAALGGAGGGLRSGAVLALDTSNAGGNFDYGGVFVNPNDGSNTLHLAKLGAGALTLGGANAYTGSTRVYAGTLRAGAGDVIPDVSDVIVSGNAAGVAAALDLNGNSDAIGTLTLGGATATSGASVSTGAGTLMLGGNVTYANANSPLGATISGKVDLGISTRTFTVNDSASAAIDLAVAATLSGPAGSGLTKAGSGVLELSGENVYDGATTVSAGVLRASDGAGLPAASPLALSGGVFETGSPFARAGGGAAGGVQITGGTSGFSAFGAPVQVVFGTAGSPESLAWGTAPFVPGTLVLNEATASHPIEFLNPIDLNGAARSVAVNANVATMSGAMSGSGSSGLTKVGTGTLVLVGSHAYAGVTTVSAGTLQLGSGATGGNGSVAGNIVNNATLTVSNFEDQVLANLISGSGNLVKSAPGTLTLARANTFTGTTTINGGRVLFAEGVDAISANKPLVINDGTLDLGSNNHYGGALSGTGGSITGTGRLTLNPAGAATYGGSFSGSVSLAKSGAQSLTLTGVSATAGGVYVNGGRLIANNANGCVGLTLKDGGALPGAATISISASGLTLDNTGTLDLTDRINDAALVTLNSGMIDFLGRPSSASAERVGPVSAESGLSQIAAVPGNGTGTALLTLSGFARNRGAVVNVAASDAWAGSGNLGQAASGYGRILVGSPLEGNLAPVNGVVPGVFNSGGADSFNLVGYAAPLQGFGPLGSAGFPSTRAGMTGAVSTDNVTGGGPVAGGGQTINSYNQGTLSFANANDLLTVNSGMMIFGDDTWGTTANRGKITSGTAELIIIKRDGNTGQVRQIHSVITDNGSPVSLTVVCPKRDRSPYLVLTAANTYSGGTFVDGANNGGILLNGTGVTIPAGGLTLNNGSYVTMASVAGQIHSNNVVTINGGGTLNLMGNNTLAGIVFNSNGGTTAPAVIPYSTISPPMDYNWGGFGSKSGTLRIAGDIVSIPANVTVTPLIDSGVLDLLGSAAHTVSVSALPEGNFVNGVGPLNGLTISSVIQNGGFTKTGSGVLSLTGANTFGGQFAVEDGILNVAALNNAGANGVVGNSLLPVILGGGGGDTGTLEFTGGTTTSTKPFRLAAGGTGAFQVDAAGTVLTLSGAVSGDGSLKKSGPGTLSLTGTVSYKGHTRVEAGTLRLSAASLADGAAVLMTSGGVLSLNFSGIDDIAALSFDGARQASGTWGAPGSGADHTSAFFTGTGLLRVRPIAGPVLLVR